MVGQANENDGHKQGDNRLDQHEFGEPEVIAFDVDPFFGLFAGQRDIAVGWRQKRRHLDVRRVLDVLEQATGGQRIVMLSGFGHAFLSLPELKRGVGFVPQLCDGEQRIDG